MRGVPGESEPYLRRIRGQDRVVGYLRCAVSEQADAVSGGDVQDGDGRARVEQDLVSRHVACPLLGKAEFPYGEASDGLPHPEADRRRYGYAPRGYHSSCHG